MLNKITKYINLKLKKDKINLSISKPTVCRILKKEYGAPRKIKKVFYLNQKQKEQPIEFCKMMLERGIKGDQIFFTDETKIEMGSYINDHIRLSKENKEKVRKGDETALKLLNRPEKKFELSIMVAGGICSQGLSNLVILEGAENEFSYAQILMYYKDDFEKFKTKGLFFEQDGAKPHTSFENKDLIEKLFGNSSFIQNPLNSPDIAYPIETLLGYIKPRIKKRDPKSLEELKEIALDEWNSIPKERIKNCGLNYVRRLKKIIEIGGGRLEECHLREIRRNAEEEENILEKDEIDNEEAENNENNNIIIEENNSESENEDILKIKYAYNDQKLCLLKKKEIAKLRKRIQTIRENFKNKEKDVELKELVKLMKNTNITNNMNKKRIKIEKSKNKNKKIKLRAIKKNNIDEINKEIKEIEKMDLIAYLNHLKNERSREKKREIDEESSNEETTIDEAITKIKNIKNLEKEEILYDIVF